MHGHYFFEDVVTTTRGTGAKFSWHLKTKVPHSGDCERNHGEIGLLCLKASHGTQCENLLRYSSLWNISDFQSTVFVYFRNLRKTRLKCRYCGPTLTNHPWMGGPRNLYCTGFPADSYAFWSQLTALWSVCVWDFGWEMQVACPKWHHQRHEDQDGRGGGQPDCLNPRLGTGKIPPHSLGITASHSLCAIPMLLVSAVILFVSTYGFNLGSNGRKWKGKRKHFFPLFSYRILSLSLWIYYFCSCFLIFCILFLWY